MYIYMYVYIHMYIYIFICVHIYMCVCVCVTGARGVSATGPGDKQIPRATVEDFQKEN